MYVNALSRQPSTKQVSGKTTFAKNKGNKKTNLSSRFVHIKQVTYNTELRLTIGASLSRAHHYVLLKLTF
jgi:hypothetical protein